MWRDGLGILDILDILLNYLEIKLIERLLNPTNALWKDLMPCQLNLILHSTQALPF